VIALSHAFAAFVLVAQGVTVPQNDGWVTDLAGLLTSDQERELEALCESYHAGTQHAIALLTVPDLGGQPIERLALEVGRTWKIGNPGLDDGAVLVVSKGDKKIRIETERGLEGELTDLISGRIIRNEIAPRFKEGDYYGGLRSGLEAIHAAIGGEYAPPEEQVEAPKARAVGLLVIFFVVWRWRAMASSRRRLAVVDPADNYGSALQSSIRRRWATRRQAGRQRGRARPRGGGGSGFGGGGGGFGGFGGGGGGFRGGGATGGW
jgi:uncharacterized protein